MVNGFSRSIRIPVFLARKEGQLAKKKKDVPDRTEMYQGYVLEVRHGRMQPITVRRANVPVFFTENISLARKWVDDKLEASRLD